MAGCVAVSALAGCGDREAKQQSFPPQIGFLGSDDVSKWAVDCEAPLVVERVCGRAPARNDCESKGTSISGKLTGDFSIATRVVRCETPGWAVWTDSDDRVVAMCTDDDVQPTGQSEYRNAKAYEFAITHFGNPRLALHLVNIVNRGKPVGGQVTLQTEPGWVAWAFPTGTQFDEAGRVSHVRSREHSNFGDTSCWEVELPRRPDKKVSR
jgi:hypothetical protein